MSELDGFTELGPLAFTSRSGPSSESRYIEVYLGEEMLSRHVNEAEAIETVLKHMHTLAPGDYQFEFRTPNRVMSVRLLSPTSGGQGTGGQADVEPPLAPSGVFNDSEDTTSFRTRWNSNSEPDLDHYNIYRSTSEFSGFTLVGQATPGQTSFTHSDLNPDTTYYVKMTAVDNADLESEFSSTASATTLASTVDITVSGISFNEGEGDQSHDLRQYYAASIPSGEDVSNIEVVSGTLPSGVSLNVANESLDFDDSEGGVGSASIEIEVTTSQTEIGTLALSDDSSGERPMTVGFPVAEGVLSSGSGLVVADSEGNELVTQWNELATWRTDGSVLHGALTFLTPSGDASGTYTVKSGTPVTGTAVSKSDIADVFDAEIKFTISGTVYSLSAADLLTGVVVPTTKFLDHTHISGSLMSEYAIGGPLRVNGNGSEHSHAQGYFYLRAFKTGGVVTHVFHRLSLEITGFDQTTGGVSFTGDVEFTVDGSTTYTNNGFSLNCGGRYFKRGWWPSDPGVHADISNTYLYDTQLVERYKTLTIPESELSGVQVGNDWKDISGLPVNLHSPGAKDFLAPRDRPTAVYLISQDKRAYDAMLTRAEQYYWVDFGVSYSMKYRDEATGYAPDFTDNAKNSLVGNGWGGGSALSFYQDAPPIGNDASHQPNGAYIPYILTAEYGYLEQVQMWASMNYWAYRIMGGGAETLTGWPRAFDTGSQVPRHIAWNLRNIIDSAVATPDTHPLKSAMVDAVIQNPLHWENTLALQTWNNLGVMISDADDDFIKTNDVSYAPWMDDFLNWAIGSGVRRGFAADFNINGLWEWKVRGTIGRLGDGSGWCWADVAGFSLQLRSDGTDPIRTTWVDAYALNFPSAGSCPTAGAAVNDLGDDGNPMDYTSQMTGATVEAVNSGVSGADAAWTFLSSRDVSHWSLPIEEAPEWAALVPNP